MFRSFIGCPLFSHGYPFGFPGGGIIMMIIFVILIAIVVTLLVRSKDSGRSSRDHTNDRALEILAERFARGEIDAQTLHSMKADLFSPK